MKRFTGNNTILDKTKDNAEMQNKGITDDEYCTDEIKSITEVDTKYKIIMYKKLGVK